MVNLKYKVIASEKQYYQYCKALENLIFSEHRTVEMKDEIALLTLLIETWEKDHNNFNDVDPIRFLRSLMATNKVKANDLAILLNVSKGYVSDILNYKKGLSKEVIRKLAARFKVSQEAFNRPYDLISRKNTLARADVVERANDRGNAGKTRKRLDKAI